MGSIDGRFEVTGVLGSGAMGEAVLARDSNGMEVVVKLLHKRLAAKPDFLERFRREIRALEKVRHPHIVALVAQGFCKESGRPYYAMEFSHGIALGTLLRMSPPFPVVRVLRLMEQVLDALAVAHAEGIIHRDLKPANLLVEKAGTPEESARIIDFGLAKHLAGGEQTAKPITTPGTVLGTPYYMAPEQLRSQPPVPETDVYAIGCILMELLTGSPPFTESRLRHLIQDQLETPPPRLDERRNAPKDLVDVLDECLAKDPSRRPSAQELGQRLAKIRNIFQATTARIRPLATPEGLAGAETLTDAKTRAAAPPPDALRAKLEVVHAGGTERIFLFAGEHLRFGRGGEKDGKSVCDLVLRSFPRGDEPVEATSRRSLEVSRCHGTFVVTEEGIAVRDEGSTTGTVLDGATLPPGHLRPLPRAFTLEIGGKAVVLKGRLLPARGPHVPELTVVADFPDNPLAGLLLERPREGSHHRYLMILREVSLGSADDDDIRLPFPGIAPGQARIAVREGRFVVAGATGRKNPPVEAYRPLEPGQRTRLGEIEIAFSLATENDMKPSPPEHGAP